MNRNPAHQSDVLLRWLLGIALALAAANLALLVVWGTAMGVLILPWFSVMVDSFSTLAALAIAAVALGRYRALREPAPFWICAAFLSFAIFAVAGILTAPDLLPDGRAIFSTSVNTNGWLWLLMFSVLASLLLVAVLVRWPRAGAPGESWCSFVLVIGALAEIVLCVISITLERYLPRLIQEGSWTLLNTIWTYVLLGAFSAGAYLSARRYRQAGDTIIGYIAIVQMILAFAMLTNVIGQTLYDPWFYWRRVLWVGGFCVMLFGLLSEYAGLIWRERESSRQLRASEQRSALLVRQSPLAIIELDQDGHILGWNPAAERVFGFSPEEAIGNDLEMIVPDDYRERVRSVWADLLRGNGGQRSTIPNVTKSGRRIFCEWHSTLLTDDDGQIAGIISFAADVTERLRAEELLRESEERLRLLFKEMIAGIAFHSLIVDGTGRPVDYRYVDVNPAYEASTGLHREELIGRTVREVLPGIEDYWIERFGSVVLTGRPVHFTDYVRDLGKYFDVIAYSLGGEQFAVTSAEVTEQVRSVAALRESEERFRAIFEQAAVGVAQAAIADGRFLSVNQKLCDILGYSRDDLLRRTFREITYPEDLEADFGLDSRLVTGEISGYSVEKRYLRRDGSPVWVGVTVSVVRSRSGEPAYYIAIVEEIGRRKAVELERQHLLDEQVAARRRIEDLALADQRRAAELRAILDNMVDAVIVVNAARSIVVANEAGARTFGLLSADEHGRTLADLPSLTQARHPDGRPIAPEEAAAGRALAGETVVNADEVIRDPRTHSDAYLRVSAAPIASESGEIVGAVIVARDVTELTELDRLKDQFIAVAAHELKTPVAIIKGYAQLVSRSSVDASQPLRRMLDAISRGADRIDRIIIELLDVSQLSAGRLEMMNETVDLPELIGEVVDRTSLLAPRHQIRVTRAEPVAVRGDRQRLDQLLTNLLDNAVRYSPNGGEIDVASTIQGDVVVVSVADHGIGIPTAKQGRIFQRFFRAHTSTPHDYGGMGVGLFISREIVSRHGGRMWFESEEGRGSTFYFSLPRVSQRPGDG